MRSYVHPYIRECDAYQCNKSKNLSPAGLLQPLPTPNRIWTEIVRDFIDGLLLSKGKYCIMVVVDLLSKYAHFVPLSHPYTATTIARFFVGNVFTLRGMPISIVSDRDPTFPSQFWKELLRLQGTRLSHSSARHP